jgi:hypothetical protein
MTKLRPHEIAPASATTFSPAVIVPVKVTAVKGNASAGSSRLRRLAATHKPPQSWYDEPIPSNLVR